MAIGGDPSQPSALERAKDPRTPGSELVELSTHRDSDVRIVLAARHDLPMATALRLAQDSNAKVAGALVENPGIADAVVQVLTEHRKGAVKKAARARLAGG